MFRAVRGAVATTVVGGALALTMAGTAQAGWEPTGPGCVGSAESKACRAAAAKCNDVWVHFPDALDGAGLGMCLTWVPDPTTGG